MTATFPPPTFTVAEYHAMIRTGVIHEDERVELLEGVVVSKMPRNPAHETRVNRLRKRIDPLLPPGLDSRIQAAITLTDGEPEPDYAVVRGADDDYDDRHPGGADVLLVAEVSFTSLAADRGVKHRVYARAGIPVYWIVNIPDRQIEVYTAPQPALDPPAYAARTDYPAGASVLVILDGVAVGFVNVDDILPA